jgi:hypothetical protein
MLPFCKLVEERRMTKRTWQAMAQAVVIVALVLLSAPRARAQDAALDFGQRGSVALSVERLFGYVYADSTTTSAGTSRTTHISALSLLGNSMGLFTIYAQPRAALDFFAADHFSVGASVSYFHLTESTDVPAGAASSSPSIWGVVLAPRVGYGIPLGRIATLWPRLGFTYARLETESSNTFNGMTTTSTNTTNLYALTIEAPFVFAVAPHFFLSAAPTVDVGLGGSTSSSTAGTSTDSKETDFGLLVGLGGYL